MATYNGWDCTLKLGSHEIINATNVNLTDDADEVDETTRDDEGWKATRPGLQFWNADFEIIKRSGDSALAAVKTAKRARSTLTALFTDPDGSTRTGTCYVKSVNEAQPVDGVVTVSVTLLGKGALS